MTRPLVYRVTLVCSILYSLYPHLGSILGYPCLFNSLFIIPPGSILVIPPLPEGGGGILFYLCPSVQDIFCRIFLCDEKCAYMFNVYKNQLSRQTGSRNLTGLKTLPTIWYTYMKLVTKYQIPAINSYWEKCDKKYLGRTDGRTEVKQYTPSPFGERGYNKYTTRGYNE
jgi:hypothetical protein